MCKAMVKEDNGLKQSSSASVESSSKRRRATEPLEPTLSRCMKEKEELEKVRRVRRSVWTLCVVKFPGPSWKRSWWRYEYKKDGTGNVQDKTGNHDSMTDNEISPSLELDNGFLYNDHGGGFNPYLECFRF
ncbi:hypothetical protein F2Q70_00008563 [Brassica cretica]|uniref:Uncharacterized protein n=1 Tax=Brassica cretica TaxID=69181 RepID=A0A8S9LWM3_BRACR|nr:hypothetical protein F2Q68_00001615 [Brassica cretica]KAF2610467.1 hypothetical protein F2Q70_00008563 [Brassica cretica]